MKAVDHLLWCNALLNGQSYEHILRKALRRLRHPDNWTREAWARNPEGRRVRACDPLAVSWDLEGAIAVECNSMAVYPPYFIKLMDEVAADHGFESAGMLNDGGSHELVLTALEEALIRVTTRKEL